MQTKEIYIPDIGSNELEVTEILVSLGDIVESEQSLITVEGDKALIEIPSPFTGIVREIKVNIGDKVKTGSLIMMFEVLSSIKIKEELCHVFPVECKDSKITNKLEINNNLTEVNDFKVKIGDNINIKIILPILKKNDSLIKEPLLFTGVVKDIKINKEKDNLNIGSLTVLGNIEDINMSYLSNIKTNINKSNNLLQTNISSDNKFDAKNYSYVHATPVIRRLARELGINLVEIKGSGRKNRILREDIQLYVQELIKQKENSHNTKNHNCFPWEKPLPKIDFGNFGNVKEIELGRIQKISGTNLHRNWIMIPHVTQFDEVDITEIESFRKEQNEKEDNKKLGVKITLLVFIMKAIAYGLKELPYFNSSLSSDTHKLILKEYINIGVAVDTPNGLLVPVFRDVNRKGIIDLSLELLEVSKKARAGQLTLFDMQGGSFTISSLGGISNGVFFTPIINAPEVAILGVSRASIKAIWNGKNFEPKLMLPLALSYDHRVIDGVYGARFISLLNRLMSDIRYLMM